MTVRGHMENGVVVLDQPAALPDGAEVHLVRPTADPHPSDAQLPTVAERLAPFIGKLKGLPPDLSANHDHYLYGTPERK